jgi:hypothetical protein
VPVVLDSPAARGRVAEGDTCAGSAAAVATSGNFVSDSTRGDRIAACALARPSGPLWPAAGLVFGA